MELIAQRIEKLIKALGYNKNSFSKAIGLNNNVTIGRIVKDKREPSYDILRRIIKTFGHRFNVNWLLIGEGSMDLDLTTTTDPRIPYQRREKDDLKVILANLESLSESMNQELQKLRDKIS